jgi:hypothetical protein
MEDIEIAKRYMKKMLKTSIIRETQIKNTRYYLIPVRMAITPQQVHTQTHTRIKVGDVCFFALDSLRNFF